MIMKTPDCGSELVSLKASLHHDCLNFAALSGVTVEENQTCRAESDSTFPAVVLYFRGTFPA
jgi:hypothetical protein